MSGVNLIVRYLTLAGMLATAAWEFWNPVGWSFTWEPLVAFLASLIAFIENDRRFYSKQSDSVSTISTKLASSAELLKVLPPKTAFKRLADHNYHLPLLRADVKPVRDLIEWLDSWNTVQSNSEVEQHISELEHTSKEFLRLLEKYFESPGLSYLRIRTDVAFQDEDGETEWFTSNNSERVKNLATEMFRISKELERELASC